MRGPDTLPIGKRARRTTLLFAIVANVLAAIVLFAFGEFAIRWRHEGSARAAVASFTAKHVDDSPGQQRWLVHDDALGYKLNPADPGVSSLGIRHREIPPDKPPGLFRVVVLGDSVAFDTDGFVTLLRNRSGAIRTGEVEVVNAAIPGYTTYQERTLLERDLLAVKPDLVILQFCLNDNHRFLHMLTKSGKWLITPEAERVVEPEGQGPLARVLQSSQLIREVRLRLLNGLGFPNRFPWDSRADFAAAWQDRTWPDVEEHVRAMHDLLSALGARFAVIAVPFEPQFQQKLLERDKDYTLKPQRKLSEICARLEVPLLDLYKAFLAKRDRALFRDGIHLTPAGHEMVAEQLLEFLTRERLTK